MGITMEMELTFNHKAVAASWKCQIPKSSTPLMEFQLHPRMVRSLR